MFSQFSEPATFSPIFFQPISFRLSSTHLQNLPMNQVLKNLEEFCTLTFLQVYFFTSLPFYKFTLLKVYFFTRLPFYKFTLLQVYVLQLHLFTSLQLYNFTFLQSKFFLLNCFCIFAFNNLYWSFYYFINCTKNNFDSVKSLFDMFFAVKAFGKYLKNLFWKIKL
jgi:hypothetical protein